VVELPDGVSVAGAKVQVTPVARPEQVKVMAWLKPFWGTIVI
jgi:selenophosphate synthetase-related protein